MTKALIIGGGIAGPVTAMALERVGVDSVIYERHERGADGVGAFLTLAVNGIAALEVLGLAETVRKHGFDTPRLAIHSGTGKRLGVVDAGGDADGITSQTLKRADLYRALRDEAVSRGVSVHYGKDLVHAETSGQGVRAEFADGTTATGDLLIGADGLHSRTRTLLDPDAPKPRFVGLLNVGGYARGVQADDEPGTMRMFFGKRCFYAYVPHPDGEMWWFANPGRKQDPTGTDMRQVSDREWRRELHDLLAVDETIATGLVEATDELMVGWPTYDLAHVPTWRRGRMVIIGDAAHATSPASGQGASMAIEDAVQLARCIRDVDDVPAALEVYERLRRSRVESVVAQGKRNGSQKSVGPVARVARDLVMPVVMRSIAKRKPLAWMTDYRIDWEASVAV